MKHFYLTICLLSFFNIIKGAEPSNQPSAFISTNIKPWQFTISFANSIGGANGYLVLRSNKAITNFPTDGIVYKKGQALGSTKVFSAGTSISIDIKECIANTKYYFAVFAYNGIGASIDYKSFNPLIDSVITTGSNIGNYYENIKPSSLTFISDLTAKLNAHVFMSYDDFEKKLVPDFYQRDTVINDTSKGLVNCEYSGEFKAYLKPFDFANTITLDYSREHVLCKNWMNKRGIPNGDLIQYPEGADYHNLLLTRTTNVNSKRSDYPYGIALTNLSTFLNSKYGKDKSGNYVFEPEDKSKGNGSRCMFYTMICYNGTLGNWGLDNLGGKANAQDQAILKLWHKNDPIDNFEIARQEYIFSLQNNRNPFIDFPDWADCIDFRSIKKLACASIIRNNSQENKIDFFTNQIGNSIHLQFNYDENEHYQMQVYDMNGRLITEKLIELNIGQNNLELDISNYSNGLFLLQFKNASNLIQHRFLVD